MWSYMLGKINTIKQNKQRIQCALTKPKKLVNKL